MLTQTGKETPELGSARLDPNNDFQPTRGSINFARVNAAAMAVLPSLMRRWLRDGRVEGNEYVALNPKRVDRNLGSFRINLRSGRWADFATKDAGGDPVSLGAYLANISQVEAAERIATMLGLEARDA
jgi:hypothetical protein